VDGVRLATQGHASQHELTTAMQRLWPVAPRGRVRADGGRHCGG
jgi:hypothetical protein